MIHYLHMNKSFEDRQSISCLIHDIYSVLALCLVSVIFSAGQSFAETETVPERTLSSASTNIQPEELSIRATTRDLTSNLSSSIICSGKWQGPNAGWLTNWYTGNEKYAVYQNPLETGCTGAYPFTVTDIVWRVTNQTNAALTIQMRPTVYAATGSVSCPLPGGIIEDGPTYGVILPAFVTALVTLPLDTPVCVSGPFFAGVQCPQFIGLGKLGINVDSSQVVPRRNCASYNDFRGSWEDLIVANNYPGNVFIWSQGMDSASGTCSISGACCVGQTGDVDCDLGAAADILDLTRLVDHLFISFEPLCCTSEANIDGIDGIDVIDLTILVDHLFIGFTPLPSCL